MHKNEFILCAAVLMYDGTIISGHRHSDCYDIIGKLVKSKEEWPRQERQGFLTSKGKFLDREMAYIMALNNKQINENVDEILISEDLY